jgi:ribonuclease HI
MKQITIVCDGSSLGNGGTAARAGAAAILSFVDESGVRHVRAVGEYLGKATNNQAEIVAACIALEALRRPCSARVVTDSTYVVETQKGNFKRKKNHDFWERLDRAVDGHRVAWAWTRGHAGHDEQERCDSLAREIAGSGVVTPEMLEKAVDGLT